MEISWRIQIWWEMKGSVKGGRVITLIIHFCLKNVTKCSCSKCANVWASSSSLRNGVTPHIHIFSEGKFHKEFKYDEKWKMVHGRKVTGHIKFYLFSLKITNIFRHEMLPPCPTWFSKPFYDYSWNFLLENVYFHEGGVNTSEVMLFQSSKGAFFSSKSGDVTLMGAISRWP